MPYAAPSRAILAVLVLLCTHAWAQPEQPADVRVLRMQIMEADTGALVGFVREGEVLDVSDFEEGELTLVALTDPDNLGTVRFYLDGARFHQRADPPYAVSPLGDDGELLAWDPPAGEHTLTVVPIATELGPDASLSNAMDRGEVGPWYEIELTGVEEAELEEEASETATDVEAQENAEEQDGDDTANTDEAPDAEDSIAPEGSGDPEEQSEDTAGPDDAEDSDGSDESDSPENSGESGNPAQPPEDRAGGVDADVDAGAGEEPREEPAPVRRDAPEAVTPEPADDAVRAPTVPPEPLESEEALPEPARPAAPTETAGPEAAVVAPAASASASSEAEDADGAPVEETLRLRWPLERMADGEPIGGDVLLSRYPSDIVILAVDLAGFQDPSEYRLSLKRNGCARAGEHLVELSPFDPGLGASLTEIAASFSALRYGNFGVVVTPGDDDQPLACAVLALDEQVQ